MDKKNIFDFSGNKAFDFLLSNNCFFTNELPSYFDFTPIFDHIKKVVGDADFEQCKRSDPAKLQNVSLNFLHNKDGRYGVRPVSVLNPYLYYFLSREICKERNWRAIKRCLKAFSNENIYSYAKPIIPDKRESFHNSTTIFNWWKKIEQQSIELAMDYKFMFVTDITNCYGSIIPQDLVRAMTMQGTKHENKRNKTLADRIVDYVIMMNNGKNIGLPQGNELSNIISEIILGYTDLLLYERIQNEGITDQYKIIRYRDDYRIFCNDKAALIKISYLLQEILLQFNLALNSSKTFLSNSIITDSIKSDKLDYIYKTPISSNIHLNNKTKVYHNVFNSFQKNLLYILQFGREHRNSGRISSLLADFQEHFWNYIFMYAFKKRKPNLENYRKFAQSSHHFDRDSITPLVSILTQIALENIRQIPQVVIIMDDLLETLEPEDAYKKELMLKVRDKLIDIPNSDYIQVWLQRLSYQYDIIEDTSQYKSKLCQFVMDSQKELWNNQWLKKKYYEDLPYDKICPKDMMLKNTLEISDKPKNNKESCDLTLDILLDGKQIEF